MGYSAVVALVNITVVDNIVIATAIYFNAVAKTGYSSSASFGEIRLVTVIVLNYTADPTDFTVGNVKS